MSRSHLPAQGAGHTAQGEKPLYFSPLTLRLAPSNFCGPYYGSVYMNEAELRRH